MNKKLVFLFSLVILMGVFSSVSAATITLPNPLCPRDANNNPINPDRCIENFPRLIEVITTYISTIIGILAVLMFVIAGIFFVISAGNPEKIERAKKIAIWAAVGVVISLMGNGLVAVVRAIIGNAS